MTKLNNVSYGCGHVLCKYDESTYPGQNLLNPWYLDNNAFIYSYILLYMYVILVYVCIIKKHLCLSIKKHSSGK